MLECFGFGSSAGRRPGDGNATSALEADHARLRRALEHERALRVAAEVALAQERLRASLLEAEVAQAAQAAQDMGEAMMAYMMEWGPGVMPAAAGAAAASASEDGSKTAAADMGERLKGFAAAWVARLEEMERRGSAGGGGGQGGRASSSSANADASGIPRALPPIATPLAGASQGEGEGVGAGAEPPSPLLTGLSPADGGGADRGGAQGARAASGDGDGCYDDGASDSYGSGIVPDPEPSWCAPEPSCSSPRQHARSRGGRAGTSEAGLRASGPLLAARASLPTKRAGLAPAVTTSGGGGSSSARDSGVFGGARDQGEAAASLHEGAMASPLIAGAPRFVLRESVEGAALAALRRS